MEDEVQEVLLVSDEFLNTIILLYINVHFFPDIFFILLSSAVLAIPTYC